ncbi:hypothetical protein IV203_008104 [Nitzschia inconspicua]|uniref:Uncharacterized protein n=1 Tax=Nitzschia inconspicua TaxID=303405 RepID=A0A9K3KYH9_9STRA|nr:hypothetical protein IV203_008104 [Nitzschia inconspicua]
MNEKPSRLSAQSRELFLEELVKHPLARLMRRKGFGSKEDETTKKADSSVASGLTMDSASSLDFCDLEHPDLPMMVGSSVSEMSSSFHNNSSSASGLGLSSVQSDLRFGCDRKLAQKYCFQDENVRYDSGEEDHDNFCFEIQSTLEDDAQEELEQKGRIKFYDSSSGKCLFMVPKESVHRTFQEFMRESIDQGYLSFRDYEVNWEIVRCLQGGEMVSTDGTRLGYFSPDAFGNRYLINLLAVAGRPVREKKHKPRRRRSMSVLSASPSIAAKKGRKALQKMLSQRVVTNASDH